MSEPRLRARLQVQAALRQASARGSFGAVVRSGDPDAGGILVLLRARAGGVAMLTGTRDRDGAPAWLRTGGDSGLGREEAEAAVARAIDRDPDLWVVEFDADDLRPPFEARLVGE